jgi:hypothetical protein
MKAEPSANRRAALAAFVALQPQLKRTSILGWCTLHVEKALKDCHLAALSPRFLESRKLFLITEIRGSLSILKFKRIAS